MSLLKIDQFKVSVEGEAILKGVDLEVKPGEIHCVMGPNGSGKSTLVNSLMGHPAYVVSGGKVELDGEDLLEMEAFERSLAGLFLAFQYPKEIAGVSMLNFLMASYNAHLLAADPEAKTVKAFRFKKMLKPFLEELQVGDDFLDRYVNQGFSGGEKKKMEILQLKLLKPKLAMLDETDSGLDVDALKIVSEGINQVHAENADMGIVIVTHYQRILEYIKPDFVHVMKDGVIVKSGGAEFASEIEEKGFGWV
jgi:Fe-S cluster assembly ATP-binding protein